MAPKSKKEIEIQRSSHSGVDYVRLAGAIDRGFAAAKLGPLARATIIDLHDVTSISSQGVEQWCEFVKTVPADVPMYLVNVPTCFAAQVEYVPNFAGHAEIVTVSSLGKCAAAGHEQQMIVDMVNFTGASQLLDRCGNCGAAVVVADLDLTLLAKSRARSLPIDVAGVLDTLGVYRRSTTRALEVQKLVEGNASLLRMSGTLDQRFRAQRLIAGLEGTLVLATAGLELTPSGAPQLSEMISQVARACSPIVIVDLPYGAIEHVSVLGRLPQVVLHSIVAPCYCVSCDEMRQLSVSSEQLLGPEPKGTCVRCGREAPMVAGMVQLDNIRPQLRPTPQALLGVIKRLDELFSAAAVEARLTTGSTNEQVSAVPQRIGPYRIVRSIARGGMADVFLAVRDDIAKPVALKLLRREVLVQARISLGMFLREARLNAKLNHPNIVQVFDVNEAEGNLYIVMEYLEGHALWRVFRQHGRAFPVSVAIRLAQQVLRALHYVQTTSDSDGRPLAIVHRDVSPSNIIIGPDGNVKLIDFGIAISGSAQDVFAGNPAWMSPEQFSGGALDGRSDLFSVATVLHELLSGKRLFDGATVAEIAQQVIRGPIPVPPGIPSSLVKVLERAHQRDPAARFQTAGQFDDALRAFTDEQRSEASEHEVRAFVNDVMNGTKSDVPRGSQAAPAGGSAAGSEPVSRPALQSQDRDTILQGPTDSLLRAATGSVAGVSAPVPAAQPGPAPVRPAVLPAPVVSPAPSPPARQEPSLVPSSLQTPLPLSQMAAPQSSRLRLLTLALFILAVVAVLLTILERQ